MIKFLDLHSQYLAIKSEVDSAIQGVIRDSAFIGGKYVRRFEEHFAEFQQAKYCIGVGNGTDALEIAIQAMDLRPGSEIIVPANSFIASSEAVTRCGHRVVFCDADPEDYTIDVEDVRRRITDNTAAIIAVHLYGHPCDMGALAKLAADHGLRLIEDCAQAHGAEYRGRRVGAIGDIGAFSFYPGKNLGAYGDGGAITTDDENLARTCRMIANHGRIEKYDHQFEGRNSRLDGLQAAILDVKLAHLEDWTKHRVLLADAYLQQMRGIDGLLLPVRRDWARHVYHLFVIRSRQRDQLRERLGERGIQTGIHYPIALPKLQAYRYLDQTSESGFSWSVSGDLLSLPIGDHMKLSDVEAVVFAIEMVS